MRSNDQLVLLLVLPLLTFAFGHADGCDDLGDEGYYAVPDACAVAYTPRGGACGQDADCERGTWCIDGACQAVSANEGPCERNAHCAEGLACSCGIGGCAEGPGVCHAPGTQAVGEGCFGSRSCAEGVCSAVEGWTCAPVAALGEVCAVPGDCAEGLGCGVVGRARGGTAKGDDLDARTTVENYAGGLGCLSVDNGASRVCAGPRGEEGQRCRQWASSAFEMCREGLVCDRGLAPEGTCVAIAAEGEPCAMGTCAEGLGCDLAPAAPRCVRLGSVGVGAPCASESQCAAGLICPVTGGVCQPERGLEEGAWCLRSEGFEREERYCGAGLTCAAQRCSVEGELGQAETCSVDAQCEAGLRCSAGHLQAVGRE